MTQGHVNESATSLTETYSKPVIKVYLKLVKSVKAYP